VHLRRGAAVHSDTVPAGEIVYQRPKPGARLADGGWLTVTLSLGVLRKPVPDVVRGSAVATARSELAAATFRVGGLQHSFSSTVPSGRVIGTVPKAGAVLRHGSPVTLVVSEGPRPRPVPDVDGLALTVAVQRLHGVGLGFRQAGTAFSDTVPAGDVLSTNPPPGQPVRPGTVIDITVSKGPQLFAVPSLQNRRAVVAQRILAADGLVARIERFPGGPGQVVAQSPAPGTLRPRGSVVTLIVF
jgi:beta-lactam-binding protein with PASTA domain